MKLKDNMEELAEEQLRYNRLVREGADQDVIDESQERINNLQERQTNIRENTRDVIEQERKVTSDTLQAGVQDIESLRQQFTDGLID